MDTGHPENVIVASAAFVIMSGCYLQLRKKRKIGKKRRWWMLSLHRSRDRYSATYMLQDLQREPSGHFKNFCRMTAEDFEFLLNKIDPLIKRSDTNMRKAIPIQERFAVALRFFATGDSFKSLSYLFKFSPQTVSECVVDVCDAIIHVLWDQIQMPKTADAWKQIAQEFDTKWNFPHCLGSLDGKHIVIQSPIKSGTEFYNYKNTFSVVLMALVDANYCFTFVDIGCQGRISDGGVFRNTVLFKKLEANTLLIPQDELLLHYTEQLFPYVFVADDAFALGPHLLKPDAGLYEKGSDERIFNYRLSRARRVVENVFGILASVFRVFRKPMLLEPEKVSKVTMACVLLHNFLRKSKSSASIYSPPGTFNLEKDGDIIPGTWRQDQQNMTSFLPLNRIPRRSAREAQEIRKSFCDYFKSVGKVSWQDSYC